MPLYVALLRGINVSGQKSIRMADLKASFAALGFDGVQNYLQSGNIVFASPKHDVTRLAASICTRIAKDFGHEVSVLVLSSSELDRTAETNPLVDSGISDESLFHCTFLFEPVATKAFAALALPAKTGERAALKGRTIYLYCPHGYGRTKLNNNYFERALKVPATTRNWRTVRALQQMCSAS